MSSPAAAKQKTSLNAEELLKRLRAEDFKIQTEEKLASHAIVKLAEEGNFTDEHMLAFLGEQYYIQQSDCCSFAHLAGHTNFVPKRLAECTAPALPREGDAFFHFFVEGELAGAKMCLSQAKEYALEERDLQNYKPTLRGQAYPNQWARIALQRDVLSGVCAIAVNHKSAGWGTMCGRIVKALQDPKLYKNASNKLELLSYFATSIDDLDDRAKAALAEADYSDKYEDIARSVRLLQEAEVSFWDAVAAAGK
jgi:hypothetical protein